ncbi:MAG: gamma-glutamylcyclotransferase family protein [Bacillota bacterium]
MCNGIFVYGTLMSGFENHEIYLAKNIITIQKATIRGRLFHLPAGYPAVIDGPVRVNGEFVTVRDLLSVLERLDELEDYHGPCRDNEYERVVRDVTLAGGEVISGYVYLYTPHRHDYLVSRGTEVLSGDWRAYLAGDMN